MKRPEQKMINIEMRTRLVLDHLKFGWMCPVCEIIYSPDVLQCPIDHKVSKESQFETKKQDG